MNVDVVIEFTGQTIIRRSVLLCNMKILLAGYKGIRRIAIVNTGTMEYDVAYNTQIVETREVGVQCFYGLETNSAAIRQIQQIIDKTLTDF